VTHEELTLMSDDNVSKPRPRAKFSSQDLLRRAQEAREGGQDEVARIYQEIAAAVATQEGLADARQLRALAARVEIREALGELRLASQALVRIESALRDAQDCLGEVKHG
jgi:hypothetical protein